MSSTPAPGRVRRWLSSRSARRTAVAILAVGVFGGVFLVGAWARACAGGACPSIAELENYDPDQASRVYAADGRLITDFGLQRRTVIPLSEMAPAVVAAFVAVEDKRFYRHHGVDFIRALGALKLILTGQRVEGFSTITMQLAGNLWPESIDRRERTVTRKLREIKVALEIEANYPKEKILELYLNQIELGNRAFGVESAAQRYFGKPVRQLNVAEAAMLAALPRAPSRYNPRRYPDAAVARRNLVISLLRDAGKLSPASAEAWKAYPISLSSHSDYSGVADYFVEYVRQQLDARFGADLYRSGLRVFTTLDLDMQLLAERSLSTQLEAIEAGQYGRFPHGSYRDYLRTRREGEVVPSMSPYLQGAVVIMEPRTGYVRALVGGRDFEDSKFNRATQALRQAGSTFKPFVYSAAVRAGYPLSEVVVDEPISVPVVEQANWEPQNYDNLFEGRMSLRRALYRSRNTVAVSLGMRVGEEAVVGEAAAFGLTTRIPAYPAIHIGAADVYILEMVAAFTAFANGGARTVPLVILRVEDRAGNILWQAQPEHVRVLTSEQAWIMLDVLRDVVRRGTAASAIAAGGFGYPSGGKTGTTNDGKDVWYLGFTSDLVAGMWMGFDNPTKIMGNATGGRLVAPAWAAMMRDIYARRRPPPDWVAPEGILLEQIDESTGFRATPFCPLSAVILQYFIAGTEPQLFCPTHSRGGLIGGTGLPH
jgi:penicillin-binding protein 1A